MHLKASLATSKFFAEFNWAMQLARPGSVDAEPAEIAVRPLGARRSSESRQRQLHRRGGLGNRGVRVQAWGASRASAWSRCRGTTGAGAMPS